MPVISATNLSIGYKGSPIVSNINLRLTFKMASVIFCFIIIPPISTSDIILSYSLSII